MEDISDVAVDQRAELHLTAYEQRIVPSIHGRISNVSADRLTDPKTNNSYYAATIQPDRSELAALTGVRLYPGIPAAVTIPTVGRSALDYIGEPLTMSFRQAFRQR